MDNKDAEFQDEILKLENNLKCHFIKGKVRCEIPVREQQGEDLELQLPDFKVETGDPHKSNLFKKKAAGNVLFYFGSVKAHLFILLMYTRRKSCR